METMNWVTFVGTQGFSPEGKKMSGDLLFIGPLPQCHNNRADFFEGYGINNRNNKSQTFFKGVPPIIVYCGIIVALIVALLSYYRSIGYEICKQCKQ